MTKQKLEQLLILINQDNLLENEIMQLNTEKFEIVNNKLYKYYGTSSYTLLNLENDIVYLNNPSSFNDPFDCYLAYSYKDFLEQCCLSLIIEDDFKMDEETCESFVKFILGEKLSKEEEEFFNNVIKTYGNEFSDTTIDNWKGKELIDKLPLFCNLLCDDGIGLARDILNYCGEMAQIQNNVRKSVDQNFLITCFSETYNNNLMWAHYADKNRGICVEYDFSKCSDKNSNYLKNAIFPVYYDEKRPQIPIKIESIDKFKYKASEGNYSLLDKYLFLLTKGYDWKYEREWRLIVQGKKERIYKLPIISKIFLGVNIDAKFESQVQQIADRKNIKVEKLYPSICDYKLEIKK